MKRLVSLSVGDALMRPAWLGIGSPLKDEDFANALDSEINNSLLEVNALEKVWIISEFNFLNLLLCVYTI